jgi:hypothetical protein
MNRIGRRIPLLIALASLAASPLTAEAALVFTDWTSTNIPGGTAAGSLGGLTVTWSGGVVAGFIAQDFTGFNGPLFTPSTPTSDAIEFAGTNLTPGYLVQFSGPVRNPVIHLKSLASTLDFGGLTVVKLSGDPTLSVANGKVIGVLNDTPPGYDANGTVQLMGTFTSIAFTAHYPGATDGIDLQIGGTVPALPGSSPLLLVLASGALLLLGTARTLSQRRA